MRVLHVISGLYRGGAERMLYNLLKRRSDRIDAKVLSLLPPKPVADQISEIGVPVESLDVDHSLPNPLVVLQLARCLRREQPDVVQTWMYHADLVGGLASKLGGGPPVIWSVRHSNLPPGDTRRRTRWTARACGLLSGLLPDRITSNSWAGVRFHRELGYPEEKFRVIPNGFDLEEFRPSPEDRSRVRKRLGIPEDARVIGHVGHFLPQKDHRTLLNAVGRVCDQVSDVHLVLVGRGIEPANDRLRSLIANQGLDDQTHLLGPRDDIPEVTNAFDVAVSSSAHGEGFSNTVGEAMACGVPCVVTDVGDSSRIVGSTGMVVPPKDAGALGESLLTLVREDEDTLQKRGQEARRRIEEEFAIDDITRRFEQLYEEVMTCVG